LLGADCGAESRGTAYQHEFPESLLAGRNYQEYTDEAYEPDYFDCQIMAVHFYNNLAFIHKGVNNEGGTLLLSWH
jgi:hypothetical protein